MSPFRLAILSLLRRRVPTLITALSIAIAVACSGILLRLYHLSTSRFDSIGPGWEAVVGAKAGGIEILLNSLNGEGPYPEFLPYKLYESLRAAQPVHFEDGSNSQSNYVKTIAPLVYFAKLKQYRVAGTDENFTQVLPTPAFSDGGWVSGDGQVVVGSRVASTENLRVGDSVSVHAWNGDRLSDTGIPLRVSGILKLRDSIWDRMLLTNVTQAQRVIGMDHAFLAQHSIWGEGVLNYFLLVLQPGGFKTLETLINRRTVGQVIRIDETRQKLEELTGAGKSIGLFVSVFVLLLSTLSVSSMLVTRFEAMTVQLAVLRALGYGRRKIAAWLIWEGVLLGLSGCILGGLIDVLGFPFLRELLGTALPPPEIVSSSPLESVTVWLLAMSATVIAIFIPLFRLYRQDVHQALKG